jgi:hypothetical protein
MMKYLMKNDQLSKDYAPFVQSILSPTGFKVEFFHGPNSQFPTWKCSNPDGRVVALQMDPFTVEKWARFSVDEMTETIVRSVPRLEACIGGEYLRF